MRYIEIVNNKARVIYIEFDDKTVGQQARNQRHSLMIANQFPNTWTPIEKCRKTFNVLETRLCNGIIRLEIFLN